MNTHFGNTILKALFFLFLITLAKGLCVKAQDNHNVDFTTYIPVKYCDLVNHDEKYSGKKVVVRASYRYGLEWDEIFGMKCLDQSTRVEFKPKTENAEKVIERALRISPPHQGTINAIFYGKFHGKQEGRYGHLNGYAYRLDVEFLEDVEIV